jgi:asparagine synthase (glutamine-hydrolysing)
LGFDEYLGTSDDEVPLAAQSAGLLKVKHWVRQVARPEFEQELGRLLNYMDQPSVDGVNTYFIAKAAAEAGLKVALSGVGADELFGGYPSFSQVPKLAAVCKRVPSRTALGVAIRHVAAPILKRTTSPKYASLLEYGSSFAGAYFLRRGMFMPWELPGILDAEIVREGLKQLQTVPVLDSWLSPIDSPYARVMASEIREYLQPRLLRDTDWAGMAHSVEIRTPYVDAFFFRQIAQLITRLPVPPSKRDLAACSAVPLLATVTGRGKTGFSVPVDSWLRESSGGQTKARGLWDWARYLGKHFGFQLGDGIQHGIAMHDPRSATIDTFQ